jgi:Fe-S cluster assembly iron-binding protein IscA
MIEATPSIEVTDRAKERLRAVLAREAGARYVRIDVGRG